MTNPLDLPDELLHLIEKRTADDDRRQESKDDNSDKNSVSECKTSEHRRKEPRRQTDE